MAMEGNERKWKILGISFKQKKRTTTTKSKKRNCWQRRPAERERPLDTTPTLPLRLPVFFCLPPRPSYRVLLWWVIFIFIHFFLLKPLSTYPDRLLLGFTEFFTEILPSFYRVFPQLPRLPVSFTTASKLPSFALMSFFYFYSFFLLRPLSTYPDRLLLGFTEFFTEILPSFYRVFTESYQLPCLPVSFSTALLPSFSYSIWFLNFFSTDFGPDRVLPGFTGFYRVFTWFWWGFACFYRVLPSLSYFYRVLPSFSYFYRGLLGFYLVSSFFT